MLRTLSPLTTSLGWSLAISLSLSLAAALVVLGTTALVSRRVGRVAVVDIAWGLVLATVALLLMAVAVALDGAWWRSAVLASLVLVWGLRLAWHVRRRATGEGQGEDPRYAAMLGEDPWRRPVAVLVPVFLVQALAAWVVSAPLAVASATPVPWWPLVWVGLAVGAIGVAFEAVGDTQLAAYKQQPREARPPVMDRGLWRYTRHPNYFGDACVWWGVWLGGALSAGWLPGLATILAPVAMTWLLVLGTGARLLERTMMQRPGYPAYAARTSMFLPMPPKRRRPA